MRSRLDFTAFCKKEAYEMKIVITENYEEMSKEAARIFLHHYYDQSQPNNMAITGGKTPKRMYEILVPVIDQLPNVNTEFFLFDEIPVKGKKQGVTESAMKEMFIDHIPYKEYHCLNKDNYEDYDSFIASKGGINFVMMGLGLDGHFCGNLSSTMDHFDIGVHAVATDINERIRNRLSFLSGGEEYREPYYYTYGPETIMNIPHIVFIVSGSEKAEILRKVVEGPIDPSVPSSVFQKHPDCLIIADKDAAALLRQQDI